MIWTVSKKVNIGIFVFATSSLVVLALILNETINISKQFLGILMLIEIAIWMCWNNLLAGVIAFEDPKQGHHFKRDHRVIVWICNILS